MINKHLVNDLLNLGMWNEDIKKKLIMENGSVQNIPEIPTQLKEVYKTVWEMSQKRILQMAANRSIFIDQSQSLNLFIADATKAKLLAAHLFGWKLGLKTGMYYLRTRAAVDALKGLGVDTSTVKSVETTSSVNNVDVPTNNNLISEQTPELVMTSERPTDSPFECEGCGS
jgi:ribonucleoside-diphosphate reductase alpha chain